MAIADLVPAQRCRPKCVYFLSKLQSRAAAQVQRCISKCVYFCPNDRGKQLSRYNVVVLNVGIFAQMVIASCSAGTTLFIFVQKGLQFPAGQK